MLKTRLVSLAWEPNLPSGNLPSASIVTRRGRTSERTREEVKENREEVEEAKGEAEEEVEEDRLAPSPRKPRTSTKQ